MLKLPAGFAQHEGDILGVAEPLETGRQKIVEAFRGRVRFAVLSEAAHPVFFLGEFLKPGVGRREHQEAARVEPFVDRCEKLFRIVEAVDQVGGQDQVVAGELGLQVDGIGLEELDPVA